MYYNLCIKFLKNLKLFFRKKKNYTFEIFNKYLKNISDKILNRHHNFV